MSILKLVKNGGADVFSTMSSIDSNYSILIEFEQQRFKKNGKEQKMKK
jgi:hypothetical protein